MKPLPVAQPALCAVLSAALSALGCTVIVGLGGSLVLAPLLPVVFVLLTVLLLWAGVAVRRLRSHRDTWMTPLLAMRTAVAARASALVGSVCAGALAGVTLVAWGRAEAVLLADTAATGIAATLAATVWTVLAVVVERWCVIDPDDDDEDEISATPA